ncbi:hypothetical protein N7494_003302 [Penicillium frequentans]|uniref:Transcription factor domain-containing protein n=1 Tax=Penicillium frequentans TaxID=3151616 RepID=A0AAD6CYQ8_9EURO|nr:hypothetical protein N7494_003302 [Penicillium glabrum]
MQAGLVEAFPALPRYTNESLDFYFHHYKTYVSHIALPFSSNIMSGWFLRTALGQPALVETVLLMSAGCLASHLIMVDASIQRTRRTIQDTLQLRSRTLKSLQNLLLHPSTCFSEETLLVIALLMCVEGAQADFESVDAHIVGLQHVITRLGGLEKISLQTLSILYCCDAMQGLNRNSPPTFKISRRWATWIRNNSACLTESPYPSPQSLGKRFFNALWFGDLPSDLIKIIRVFGKLISIHERMIRESCSERT